VNWLVSGLATGCTVVLYEGSPLPPGPEVLWQMAERERITVFGTSPKYLAALDKAGYARVRSTRLPRCGTILSTGSPLAAEQFDYVYRAIKEDVHLASISGGTDLLSCFCLGSPGYGVPRRDPGTRSRHGGRHLE